MVNSIRLNLAKGYKIAELQLPQPSLNHQTYSPAYYKFKAFATFSTLLQNPSYKSFMMTTSTVPNFEPQVRDTTNGPHIHTYTPRDDGSVMIGGVIYRAVPSAEAATGTIGVNTAAGVVPVNVTQAVPPLAHVTLPVSPLPMVHSYQFPCSCSWFGFSYYRASHSLASASILRIVSVLSAG